MTKEKIPTTPAIRMLKEYHVDFSPRLYKYEDRGGTRVSSRELGVDEHTIIKTLVMEDENRKPLIVLMHGDKQVSTKNLARITGTKTITPCDPKTAQKHTGYIVGGTSPFGTRTPMPVYIEKSILDLSKIIINGGRRGLLVEISSSDILKVLSPTVIEVGY